MAKYFVYFSATGNGDFLASLYEAKGYQPVKVETVKPLGKINFFKIIKLGGEAGMKKKEKIKELSLELKEDDEVIIGSPIWNDRLSTPINTVLDKYQFNKETTKFVLYPAGEKTKASIKRIKKMGFIQEPLVIVYPLKNQDKVKEFLK